MIYQYDLVEGLQEFRNKVKNLFQRLKIKSLPVEDYKFDPDMANQEKVATAPQTREKAIPNGTSRAKKMVRENENASMQDKSYSFDESTTDADYDTEDDLNFSDDDGNQDGR